MTNYETAIIEKSQIKEPELTSDELKKLLISCIMELTDNERKELLAMWKGRKENDIKSA